MASFEYLGVEISANGQIFETSKKLQKLFYHIIQVNKSISNVFHEEIR